MPLLPLVTKIHETSLRLIPKVRMTNDVSRMVVLLYASMIEQTDSFLLLANNGRRAGTHAIFRSFLEAYVDLKALAKDDAYLHHMYASYHREWLRVLREANTNSNQYLVGIRAHIAFFETQQDHAGKLERLKANKFIPLTAEQRFERAGMLNEYRSIYNFLCRETHNNISALMSRHMEQDGDGIAFVLNKGEDSHALPDSFAVLLIAAGVLVHDWAETGLSTQFVPLSDQLDEIRHALGAGD